MLELKKSLKEEPVVYVTRDFERANGFTEKGFYIITNTSEFARGATIYDSNIILIDEQKLLDTHELLNHPETKAFLKKLTKFKIVVFKNTHLIETVCEREGWKLINPSYKISEIVEEKISQYEWLGELRKYLPKTRIVTGRELLWEDKPYVLQFNRSHSGKGTFLIDSAEKIVSIKKDFPNRPVRVTQLIKGPTFTNNNVVWDGKVLVGDLSYQITGMEPFTDNAFTTVGNDWILPKKILSKEQIEDYKKMVTKIGKKLAADGWRGLFGADAVLDEKTGRIHLIEINVRQPASAAYESKLQGRTYPTTFQAHLSALLGLPCEAESLPKVSGAQVLLRITPYITRVGKAITASLEKLGLTVIHYPNTGIGKELLRIQSKKGIMATHGKFNELGQKIAEILK